ncbi:MAG: OmpA family protein [Pseudomonadota bacterium]
MRTAPLVLLLLLPEAGVAQPKPVQMPEGAQLVHETNQDYGRVTFPTAPALGATVQQDRQEGKVRTSVFQFPATLPLDVLMATVRSQVAGPGREVFMDCTSRTCGGFDFRQALDTVPPPAMVVDLAKFGYLAVRDDATGQVDQFLLSLAGDTGYLQHVVVTPTDAPQTELVPQAPVSPVDAQRATEGLFTDRGTVVLDGLIFETGSAALSDEDYPGLKELAGFLNSNPEALVILVGHTDAEGGLQSNIALSRQRAEAVRSWLIEGLGVSPDQLEADGVGYLAPRASNATQEGRLRNRRVEAVLMDR